MIKRKGMNTRQGSTTQHLLNWAKRHDSGKVEHLR